MGSDPEASNFRKPVLRVFRSSLPDSTIILDYNYQSGPERAKNNVKLTAGEYRKIVKRVLGDPTLTQDILKYWLIYAENLKMHDLRAPAPPRNHHSRFLKMCDNKDEQRAALISMLLSERIESEVLEDVIRNSQPDLASFFEVRHEVEGGTNG